MSTTFVDLGIPFPLFQAAVEEACDFLGRRPCSLCKKDGQYCFRLDIGCAMMLPCLLCDTVNGLDAYDRTDTPCRSCGAIVSFPETVKDEIAACYDCLRAGKAAITKDTELGMVSWEETFAGVTHGLPGLIRPEFEMVPRDGGWTGVRLPQAVMFELLRTPTYSTIQGDRWLFCCGTPMIYVGAWSRAEFSRRAPDGDGQKFFNQVVEDVIPGLWEDAFREPSGIYVFCCSSCECFRAHWDLG